MAKISRRAVASSSMARNTTTNSTGTTSTRSATVNSSYSIPISASGSSDLTNGIPHGNTIAYLGKPAYQRLSTSEYTAKFVASTSAFSNYKRSNNAATTTDKNETKLYTAQPTLIDSVKAASPAPPHLHNKTTQAQILAAERERIRAEFFATYDVMTGVRIAATLSGFFGLMVFLIVWKSRSSSNETMKVLKDPKMAAVAAVCMQEEEEREIQEAMVATGMSIYPDEYDAIVYRRQRMLSLGNVSAPPMLNRGFRFSSVGGGGYSSLLEPPTRRFSYSAASAVGSLGGNGTSRRKSGSESSRILSNFQMGNSFGNDDFFIETDDELEHGDHTVQKGRPEEAKHRRSDSTKSKQGFLEVPLMGQDSRRSSAMTCCSTDSSYLERRCSAFTLGLSNLPPSLQRKLSTASRTSSTDNWDYFYPDIQVIQPTPKQSPCPSERSIYDQLHQTVTTTAKASITNATSTSKTVKSNTATSVQKSVSSSSRGAMTSLPSFVRKHSIAYYDPESAQAGRKQQIHSISADTVDIYPYNQTIMPDSGIGPLQSAPPASLHPGFHFTESPMEELFSNMRRKIAVVELQRPTSTQIEQVATIHHPPASENYENNNSFPYTSAATTEKVMAATTTGANSSSISIDSTPVSIDKLNGSCSLGTISAKALFNVEKRAPLASLSSFKISSIDYPDSEMRTLDDDSVFLDSAADTDEDMQQLSSDSEDVSLGEQAEDDIVSAERQPELNMAASTSKMAAARLNQPLKYPVEKRFSLGTSSNSRLKRPLLQRHQTISASSSDRISLLTNQQLKEFPSSSGGSGTQTPSHSAQKTPPLETHFGAVICTSSPPTHPRRAQLLQQYSDPPTTTTTTTTEEDTCSTLNTEVCGSGTVLGVDDTDSCRVASRTSGGFTSGDGGSTTQAQHSSLNTVVSFGRSSPLTDSVNVISCRGPLSFIASNEPVTSGTSLVSQTNQQLPRTRLADDPCASSISDSVINTRYPIISMPSSLKNLILRGGSVALSQNKTEEHPCIATVSRSATNVNVLEAADDKMHFVDDAFLGEPNSSRSACQVTLELPLIRVPTDKSSESSSASDHIERSRSKSGEKSRDPSLPGSSRKWSKETLF